MKDFFNFDGPFFTIITRAGDLILLNILWLICCIPIVTIGAATTALYFETMKLAENNEGYVAKNFFRSFKENLLQSTIIWVIMLAIGFVLGYFFYTVFLYDLGLGGTEQLVVVTVLFMLAVVYAMIFVYIFALQSKFVNKVKHTFKNAIVLGIRHLPYTAILIASYVLAIFLYIKFSFLFPVFIFVGVAAIAYGQSFIYNKIFNIYINRNKTPEELEKQENPDAWTIPEE